MIKKMNQDYIKIIGMKAASRVDALLSQVSEVEGLKDIFDMDYNNWCNFDSWQSIDAQKWIFARALDVYRGKKIDIKCNCCEHIEFFKNDFKEINEEKCYGIKSAYMIEKVLDEIVLAKSIRENDGTYST